MVFSTPYFLFLYLPIVLLLYYIVPLKLRNLVLLIVSLIFYGWGEPKLLFLMIFTILMFYFCGLMIGRKFGTRLAGKASILGGIILIAIGIEIFVTGIF